MVPWKTFTWKCCTAGFQPPPLFLFAHVSAELVPWSTVPTPLKCGWSRAVWISSSGGACASVRLILSLWKSWIYFWLFSVAWTGNETAYWPWRFIWTSLIIVEGFWDREKDFFFKFLSPAWLHMLRHFPTGFCLMCEWQKPHVYQLQTHFTSLWTCLYWSGLVIYEQVMSPPGNYFVYGRRCICIHTSQPPANPDITV